MASSYSISGLASGLDWTSMISQLVAVQRNPITLLENRQDELSEKKDAWAEVNTKLTALKTAVSALSAEDDFDVYTASATVSGGTSSEVEDLLSYAAGTDASKGSYNIVINQLATADKIASNAFSSSSDDLNITGTLTINDQSITVEATDSLSDIQDKINDLNSGTDTTGVTASIIKVTGNSGEDVYRLTLTADETGEDGLTVSGSALSSLGNNEITAGQDAIITVDEYSVTRSSNTITDVIEGVTLNLVGADPDATITLNVSPDNEGMKEKIQEFVDAYNDLMDYIADQSATPADDEDAEPLYADSSLRTIKSTLRSIVQSEVSGLDSTLDHLSLAGISIDEAGQLSIDDDTLDGYLESNFQDVMNLFVDNGTTTGIAEQLDQALEDMTDSIDGYVAGKQTSLQDQIDRYDEKIEEMEARLTRYEETLTAKYTAMETMLSTLQSTQSWLESQISSLSSS